jgi:hypothetical protein
MRIDNQEQLDAALKEIWAFHERCPEFSGTETDADILFRRLNATDAPVTVDNLQQTYEELKWAGLLEDHAPTPPPAQEPEVHAVENQDFDEYEVQLDPGVNPEDITVDGLIESLPSSDLRGMIEAAERNNTPQQKSVWDEVDGLSTAELAMLIGKLGKQ